MISFFEDILNQSKTNQVTYRAKWGNFDRTWSNFNRTHLE